MSYGHYPNYVVDRRTKRTRFIVDRGGVGEARVIYFITVGEERATIFQADKDFRFLVRRWIPRG